MPHVTRLLITLRLEPGDEIEKIVSDLPNYCSSSFESIGGDQWSGEFIVSCPVAPELAAEDFTDDLSPHFPALVRFRAMYDAFFALEIAVGSPAPDTFELHHYSVAMLAALGASITIRDNAKGA